jgi:hypothetical protein
MSSVEIRRFSPAVVAAGFFRWNQRSRGLSIFLRRREKLIRARNCIHCPIACSAQDACPGRWLFQAHLNLVETGVGALRRETQYGQRVLLLISENRDHGSHIAKTDEVVAALGNSSTVIYALAFSPSLSQVTRRLDSCAAATPLMSNRSRGRILADI